MLLDIIKKQSLAARKAKDSVQANLLGMILADIQNRAKEAQRDPTEDDCTKAVKSAIKKNAQAIAIASTDQLVAEQKILHSIPLQMVQDNTEEVQEILNKLFEENADKVETCKEKPQNRGWFVGQVMKATGGKSNPATVNALLEKMFA